MPQRNELRAVLEEQRVELYRQRRQIELSVRRTADLQAQVDRLQMAVERAERLLSERFNAAPGERAPGKRSRAN